MSYFWRELRSEYAPLPLFDSDPMSENYWLENMIEDRLYVFAICNARNKSLFKFDQLIHCNHEQGHDHHIGNGCHQKRR